MNSHDSPATVDTQERSHYCRQDLRIRAISAISLFTLALLSWPTSASPPATQSDAAVRYHTTEIHGIDIFYREAGPKDAPTIVLLHGFPTTSNMFRNLIPILAQRYRVIAPDYPGFGHSEVPDRKQYRYTFDGFAQLVDAL